MTAQHHRQIRKQHKLSQGPSKLHHAHPSLGTSNRDKIDYESHRCPLWFVVIVNSIIEEIGGDVFCLMVDESADVSDKEQMAVVLRYVDQHGVLKERLIAVIHVNETTALCLKSNIDKLFTKYKLSWKQVRGQGYDGASNMRVLEYVEKDDPNDSKRRQARGLIDYLQDFDFVFHLHLMLIILGHANALSLCLQRKDRDILEAMLEVKSTKEKFQEIRDDG
uniref:DUF4371 domain-containing protein n=1 Tax=Oryza brachyantha TaxID=4533 RepID=J3MW72_ORYBR